MGQLPEGWVEYKDKKSGKSYYYNKSKGVTTWDIEDVMGGSSSNKRESTRRSTTNSVHRISARYDTGGGSSSSRLPTGWVELQDPNSGKPYYYNSETQVTSWDQPAAVVSSRRSSAFQNRRQSSNKKVAALGRQLLSNSNHSSRRMVGGGSNRNIKKEEIVDNQDPDYERLSIGRLQKIQMQKNKLLVNAAKSGSNDDDDNDDDNTKNRIINQKYSRDPLEFTREFLLASPPGQYGTLMDSLYQIKSKSSPYKKRYMDGLHRDYHKLLGYGYSDEPPLSHILAHPLYDQLKAHQKQRYADQGITARYHLSSGEASYNNDDDDLYYEQYGYDTAPEIVLNTHAELNEPQNLRSGSWSIQWSFFKTTLNGDNLTVELCARAKVAAFVWEDANTHMRTFVNFPPVMVVAKPSTKDPAPIEELLAKRVLKYITTSEKKIYDGLTKVYSEEEMDATLKQVRRVLPITHERLPWDKLAHRASRTKTSV